MSTCSCCTLIVWSWSIKRSYIKDYKQDHFIRNPRSFTQKFPSIYNDCYVHKKMQPKKYISDRSETNMTFTKNKTYSLSCVFEEIYYKSAYAYVHLIIYILISYLTHPYFRIATLVPNIVKAGGMIIYKNKILIVQSNFNKWGFPKGHRNFGEGVLECAIREIKEETSLVVDLTEKDRLLYSCDNTVMYYKKLNCKPKISIKHIIQEQKDCTGIAWIRLSCLKKQINGKNSIPFTSLLRNFVMHYF